MKWKVDMLGRHGFCDIGLAPIERSATREKRLTFSYALEFTRKLTFFDEKAR